MNLTKDEITILERVKRLEELLKREYPLCCALQMRKVWDFLHTGKEF